MIKILKFNEFINENETHLNRILDKISSQGLNSLNNKEKTFLDDISKHGKSDSYEKEEIIEELKELVSKKYNGNFSSLESNLFDLVFKKEEDEIWNLDEMDLETISYSILSKDEDEDEDDYTDYNDTSTDYYESFTYEELIKIRDLIQ